MDAATVYLQQIYYVLKTMSIIQFYLILASELDSDSIEPTELTELLYMKQFQDVNHTFQIFVYDSGGSTESIND